MRFGGRWIWLDFGRNYKFVFTFLYSRRKDFQGVHELAPLGSPPRPCSSKLGMALGLIERLASPNFLRLGRARTSFGSALGLIERLGFLAEHVRIRWDATLCPSFTPVVEVINNFAIWILLVFSNLKDQKLCYTRLESKILEASAKAVMFMWTRRSWFIGLSRRASIIS